uniref:Sulfite oxidase n=1 Tax=Globisporangium ultimum (strain ATCC 200006 / CBS 805.95 / DAOM BR144) TaxID=431595 RepID=K3WL08_GLOUD
MSTTIDQKQQRSIVAEPSAGPTQPSSSYALDPTRDPVLKIRAKAPFNAEPPPDLLLQSFVTPNELFFVRNHLPVPTAEDLVGYTLKISGLGLDQEVQFTLDELKTQFKHKTITVTIQCAGNRRSEMSRVKTVRGLVWGKTAISTAQWTGVLLADVLKSLGISEDNEVCPAHGLDDLSMNDSDSEAATTDRTDCVQCANVIKHVHLEALDTDPADGKHYGASIPISTTLDPRKDVLLAFAMNGESLPRDHGFPLRAIVPGTVGARNVKFLHRIVLSQHESPNFWQQKDYRGFPPNVDYKTENYLDYAGEAIQELPVQSAIMQPNDGATVVLQTSSDTSETLLPVEGYAWSGGGRSIVRVDVSIDGGHTWTTAKLHEAAKRQRYNRAWAWTPWTLEIRVPRDTKEVEVICKAVDSSYNVQPDTIAPIWNMRGMLNNAWNRVKVQLAE